MKFKVGDRVRIVKCEGDDTCALVGSETVIAGTYMIGDGNGNGNGW